MTRKFKKSGVNKPKDPFLIYNSNDNKILKSYKDNQEIINCCVIDPGSVNCGLFIFSFNISNNKIYPLLTKNLEFKKKGKDHTNPHFSTSIKLLDELENVFLECHYVIIESQIGFAYNNTRIAQHLISYFMTKFRNRGKNLVVIEMNSSDKIRMLGCDLKEKKDYKKWSVEKAREFINNEFMENKEFKESYENGKKKDDKADAICIGYVFIRYLKNNLNEEPIYKIPLPV